MNYFKEQQHKQTHERCTNERLSERLRERQNPKKINSQHSESKGWFICFIKRYIYMRVADGICIIGRMIKFQRQRRQTKTNNRNGDKERNIKWYEVNNRGDGEHKFALAWSHSERLLIIQACDYAYTYQTNNWCFFRSKSIFHWNFFGCTQHVHWQRYLSWFILDNFCCWNATTQMGKFNRRIQKPK